MHPIPDFIVLGMALGSNTSGHLRPGADIASAGGGAQRGERGDAHSGAVGDRGKETHVQTAGEPVSADEGLGPLALRQQHLLFGLQQAEQLDCVRGGRDAQMERTESDEPPLLRAVVRATRPVFGST